MAATAPNIQGANLVSNHRCLLAKTLIYYQGAHIMLAGIVFQLGEPDYCLFEQIANLLVSTAVIIVYAFCGIEYYLSYSRNSLINSHFDKETNSDTTAQVRGTYTENLKRMAYALVFTTICLFIRYVPGYIVSRNVIYLILSAIYRTIELSNGWNGRIISTQRYFSMFFTVLLLRHAYLSLVTDVLDGAMVVLAIYTFNLAHPGRLFAVPSVCTKFSSA